jgi:hypothetical protein
MNNENLKPWAKGQSGNPNGRPVKSLTTVLRKVVAQKREGECGNVLLAKKLRELAFEGGLEAIKYIYDRLDGRPVQALEHSGPEGGPIALDINEAKRLANAVERLSAHQG